VLLTNIFYTTHRLLRLCGGWVILERLEFFIPQTKHPELAALLAYLSAALSIEFIFDGMKAPEHMSRCLKQGRFIFRVHFLQMEVLIFLPCFPILLITTMLQSHSSLLREDLNRFSLNIVMLTGAQPEFFIGGGG
jgi:hypothetical protein